MRRWVLRAGLVLAAGAASLAVTSGAAQADSGLSGTLDHVSSTVKKVTGSGSSHSSSHASTSSHSSSSHSSSSHASRSSQSSHSFTSSSKASSPRVSVRRTVLRPVVRPVVSTVHRVAKPVVRVESAHDKRVARQVAAKAEQKKRVQRADAVVGSLSRSVLHLGPTPAKSAHTAPAVTVRVDVAKTTKAVADVTSAVATSSLLTADLSTPRTPLGLPAIALPDLGVAVDLPAVDLGAVSLPSVGLHVALPAVPVVVDLPPVVGLPAVPAPAAGPALSPASSTSTAARPGPATSAHVRPSHREAGSLPALTAAPAPVQPVGAAVGSDGRADGHGVVATHVEAGSSVLVAFGAAGAGAALGLSSDGSAQAGTSGLLVFALAATAGLAGLKALHARPAHARSGHALRLLRQPGFSPD